MQDFRVGSVIDEKYRVLALIGSGGLGTVYKAEHAELTRIVAVKVLRIDGLLSQDSRARFEREARILASFSHKNIVSVYSVGLIEDKQPYMAMEFLEGTSLGDELTKTGRIPWKRAINIVMQICAAAQYAHERGIIHRDLKPQNIMLLQAPEPDLVKVLDFGLSRIAYNSGEQAPQKLTQTGTLIGSIHYMAPELCTGNKANERTDIYALACIMYEMLSGKVPFDAENPMSILHKHLHSAPEQLPDDVPLELQHIVLKAIQKDPENRFVSMAELLSTLQRLNSGDLSAKDIAIKELRKKESRISLAPTLALIFLLFAAIGLFSIQKRRFHSPPPNKPPATIENRKNTSSKIEQLVNMAESFASRGRNQQANIYMERALKLLAHGYPSNAITTDVSKKNLDLLRKLALITDKTHPKLDNLERVSLEIRATAFGLTEAEILQMDEYLIQIQRNNGYYLDALQSLLDLVELMREKNRTPEAQNLLNRQKPLFEKDPIPKNVREFYFHLIAARIACYRGQDIANAKKELSLVEKHHAAIESLTLLQKSSVLLALMVSYAEIGDHEKFAAYSKLAKEHNEKIINPHMHRLNLYYYLSFHIYADNFKDLKNAKQTLIAWQAYLDSLESSRRQERMVEGLEKAKQYFADLESGSRKSAKHLD